MARDPGLRAWVQARLDLGLSPPTPRFPRKGTCLSIYSRAVNTCMPLGHVLAEAFHTGKPAPRAKPEGRIVRLGGTALSKDARRPPAPMK